MKKLVVNIALASLVLPYAAYAMDNNASMKSSSLPPAPKPTPAQEAAKIRYVDPYKIIPNLEQWKDERVKIQANLEARTKQIEDLKNSYAKKAQELQSRGNLVTGAAQEAALKDLKRLETNIQIEQQSFQEFAERTTQEAQMMIFREIETAAKQYAQENNIDLIFAGGAIYVNEKYDISENIAQRMNKSYLATKKTETKKP